jgi:hypothetical protein
VLEGKICVYCLENTASCVFICPLCRHKYEQAKRDAEWYKKMANRERAGFFRLSRENTKLREHIALLEKKRGRKP